MSNTEDTTTKRSKSSGFSSNRVGRPEILKQSMPIPSDRVGWIVGRQGTYINQLCQKSGAHVTVSHSESYEFGIVWKYVMIHGTGREVDRAKKLLHIRLERYTGSIVGSDSDQYMLC
mmetsp:Transcript_108246/g.305092  ORF Transcript_108246/g.305092 Transcript_108246/m.305092 type:complete len:117 (-) Transcript_108246:99-449(-)